MVVALSESLTIAGNPEGDAAREAAIALSSRRGEVAAIDQGDAQPTHRSVTRDCGAADATADYGKVEAFGA